jgi:hypothetical protein
MRNLLLSLLTLLCLASGVQAQIEKLPEFNTYRYGVMYYSIWDDINGYTLKGRVRPHYTMGVLDTIIIDSQTLPINEYINEWRIRYEPRTLTPAYRVMEQWNSSWVRYQVDSFKYADGLRVERYTQFYDAGLPLYKERTFYVYDNERRLRTSTEEYWKDTAWVFKVKHGYFHNEKNEIELINDSSVKMGPKGKPLMLNWRRETWDYFDDKLDEINRDTNLFPNPVYNPIERFRYTQVVARGPSTLAISDTLLEFETTVGSSQSKFFTVTNPGNEASSVSRLSFIESGSFSLHGLPPTPFTIMPGESIIVEARYNPIAKTQEQDSAIVFLDGTPLRPVILRGVGRKGIIQLSQAALDFGTVNIDTPKSMTFDLRNIGDAGLGIDSITSSDPHFTVSVVAGPLAIAQSKTTSIKFDPTDSIAYQSTITIYYQDQIGVLDTTILAIGNGFITKPDTILSASTELAKLITISPNPATKFIRIHSGEIRVLEAYAVSITGNRYDLAVSDDGMVSIEKLPAGAATLFLQTSEGMTSAKIMILR